jgi:protein gp37
MQKTDIGWTDYSSNPLKYRDNTTGKVVWGCVKTSPGCNGCYAEASARRWDRGGPFTAAAMRNLTPFLDEKELRSMLTYKPASGKRCFCADMTDAFGEWVPDEMLDRLFAVFALRKDVVWQVLTKRAERMQRFVSERDGVMNLHWLVGPGISTHNEVEEWCRKNGVSREERERRRSIASYYHGDGQLARPPWPLPNVHLGVSVEDQAHADERVPALLQTPAAVRFLSVEPMLAEVSIGGALMPECPQCGMHVDNRNGDENGRWCERCGRVGVAGIDWVIIGGESGPHFRPCDPAWIVALAEQCVSAGVPVFIKQDAGQRPGMQGAIPDSIWALKQFPACAGVGPG